MMGMMGMMGMMDRAEKQITGVLLVLAILSFFTLGMLLVRFLLSKDPICQCAKVVQGIEGKDRMELFNSCMAYYEGEEE